MLSRNSPSFPFPQISLGDTRPYLLQSGYLQLNHHKRDSQITKSKISFFPLVWSNLYHFLVHQPAATNSMHLQSTHLLNLHHPLSDPHLKSGRRSAVQLFCGNSQHVNPVDCFRRGVPSLMFDGFLYVTLCEEISTTGITQGNLELPLPPDSLDSHQTQEQ